MLAARHCRDQLASVRKCSNCQVLQWYNVVFIDESKFTLSCSERCANCKWFSVIALVVTLVDLEGILG